MLYLQARPEVCCRGIQMCSRQGVSSVRALSGVCVFDRRRLCCLPHQSQHPLGHIIDSADCLCFLALCCESVIIILVSFYFGLFIFGRNVSQCLWDRQHSRSVSRQRASLLFSCSRIEYHPELHSPFYCSSLSPSYPSFWRR
jgi:hypothetical protein